MRRSVGVLRRNLFSSARINYSGGHRNHSDTLFDRAKVTGDALLVDHLKHTARRHEDRLMGHIFAGGTTAAAGDGEVLIDPGFGHVVKV